MPTSKQQKILLEQEQQKYHCRFCNKGFSTGRALGGHMRTHGMYIEPIPQPDEGPSSTGAEGNSSDGNHLIPSSHICEFCREEFCSLKSLSKHCCGGFVGAAEDENNSNGLYPPSFPRARTPTPPPCVLTEEEHLANCLVFLSSARANPVLRNTDAAECSTSVPIRITDAGECSTSGREELVDYVVSPPPSPQPEVLPQVFTQSPPTARQLFECKTCQKVFTSHQALGGHRASHKKVKGCFSTRLENKPPKMAKYTTTEDESNNRFHQSNQAGPSSENMALAIVPFVGTSSQLPLPKKKSKVHECSVCKRQFPSGQALGGHKRCHWSASSSCAAVVGGDAVAAEPLSVASTELQVGNSSTAGLNVIQPHPMVFRSTIFTPDLNMPARPMDDFPQFTLWFDMPTAVYLEPERENARENVSNVNIEEAESREVRLTNLSDLIDINEREDGSKWLEIGFGD